jgi:uncharacterized repeat protein (TIGR01451 family)
MRVSPSRYAIALLICAAAAVTLPLQAATTLTVTPLTWNVIGLDSNSPTSGPRYFPVGARVCSSVATSNVAVNYVWDTANANVNLRSGSLSTINIASIGAGACSDAYFEIDVTQLAAAYDTTRRYHITATDGSGTASTPTPRELYVEHLISQNRNSISDVKFGPSIGSLTSVPAGGSMNLVVGNTYIIQLIGGTATQGYNQFEEFINFPNTIFQVQSVSTSYSADDSPYVANPNDKLYADACLWQNDPNAPTYRSCVGGDFKAGGSTVVTTYTIKIISGGGTSQSLSSLLYDFSGSSYHYNSDFGVGARIANIIDPTSATISKSFSPNPVSVNGVSILTLTLSNPNGGALSGYNFVDNLPANLVIASPAGATTSGCGTPTLTANAGASSISFSNGTLAANSNCIVKVNVTPSATGSLVNTTNDLFIDSVDTGHNATATLTVNSAPPPGTGFCGVTLANWSVPNGTTANPPDLTGGVPTVKAANVSTATLAANVPADTSINTTSGHTDTTSWSTFGYKNGGQFVTFTVDTTNYTAVQFSFWVANPTPANGPTQFTVSVNAGAGFGAPVLTVNTPATAFTQHTIDLTGLTNTSGNTLIRISATGANSDNSNANLLFDDMVFTGCTSGVKPTIAKAFGTDPIAVNGTSTLTFTLTNTNTTAVTGAAFTDTLPSGLQVAATPSAATTCGGTWAPTAGATSLTFSGGTIPASGSCTVSVSVTATTSGPHSNVSGTLSTTETGTTTTSVATASLTAVLPPAISKQFAPNPILAGGTSTLTFTITNPNENNALSGVAFSDTFPTSPGAMVVAGTPGATTSGCGSPTFAPAAGAGSISFSGGSLAAGGTCTVTVNITAPTTGTYNNTSGNVSHIINAQTVNGNTASASLTVNPPHPSIGLLKQIGLSASGPWEKYLAVTTGTQVYYQFTVENTGDVPLSPISITDDTLNVSTCNATFASMTLPVAVAANNNHIVTCVVGPVTTTSGSHTNTAHATGTYSGTPYNSPNSSATYATTGLTLAKSVTESSYTIPGDMLHYSYLVTNSGFATLAGPVTVSDNKTTVTCPAVNTVGDLDNFLDPGEAVTCTATYTIIAGDITAASVTNTASASADGVTSNSASRTVPLSTSADVSLVKTLTTSGPFTAGQSISYTLVVANGGPSTATSIQVTDTPTNLAITNVSGSGCAALPCTIASLASSANTTIDVTATITAAGAFDNSATATAAQPDPNTANNTDNTGNGGTAAASADVSIVKTLVTAAPYYLGQSASYTLVVANGGPSTATSVQVTDTPTNLAITNVSGSGCSALPCTIASIASGANTTINVTATITAAGAFDNTATANGAQSDPNTANNTDSTGNGGTAAPSADVSIVKTLTTSGPYAEGQSISYTLVVANAGPSGATNIQVTDTPSNLSITNVSGSGCSALPCTIASLASSANTTINVTATISAAGAFDNTASATATEFDPNTANNTDSTGNGGTASASADVSLVKTLVTSGPFVIGQSVSYTLVVANAGPSTATSIQVTDTPTNLSITNVSGSGCSALPCTIASIASGANTTINVTATITAVGAFDNSATATATEFDPNTANNTDSTGNGGTAAPSADVSLTKTLVTSGPFVIGQSVSYTLVVANAGPSTATSIQVTDTPTNLSITNVSGSGCSALPCTIASIASGANTTINVTATITAVGAFDNSATAMATEFDPNTANNTDSTGNGGTAAASADVSLVKTLVTAGPFVIGQSVSYTLVVANAGPSTATSIQVSDTPTNLSVTNVSGSGCSALPCTIASIASGANTTINVTATITAVGAFDNSATATATEFDPNTANNTDSTGNGGTASASADVSLVKTLVTAGPFVIGQSVSYTLVVANAGPSTATSIQVSDTPTNLSVTNVSGSGCSALPCTIASIASGANTTINVTATITAVGAFDNSATATAAEFDPNTANNTDSTGNGGTASASADVSLVKTLVTAGPFIGGQSVSYTLVVANAGPSTATSIQVTDTPTNLTITNVSGSGCSALPCTIASLASGANTTINVTATINANGAFDNSATATATESDPNTANNTDSTGNGGTAGAGADVSIDKSLTTAAPYFIGQSVSYTLTVANAGPSPATSIQVTDTPTGLAITNVSGSGCSALPCTIASLNIGTNTTITVTATVTASAFDNSATATAAEGDPVPGNNTDNTGNGGGASSSADVSLVKTLTTSGPFVEGQSVSYTLVVANAGPSTATSIQVTDTPTNLTITNVSGSGCSALPCTIPSLPSGANTTINVTATINAAGAFDNSATATPVESDPNPSDNTDSSGNGGTADPSADVSLVKTLTTSGPFTIGQSVTYTLVVANAGPSTATNIQVTDTPTNLTITNVSGSGCSALPCTIASLASSANTTITVTATIDASGTFDNSATATGAEFDPNTANNTDNTGNAGSAGTSADVSIVKTLATSGPFTAGQSISYTLVVANGGPSTATSIQVTDTPTNLSITNVSGAGCSALPCTIASLASGANTTINVTATIVAAGAFDNTATATALEFDPNTANNTDSTGNGGTAAASADVSLVKTLVTSGPFTAGQSISYTLVVANGGPSTATSIQVTDTPTNLSITNVSGSGCSALPCTIPSLASGANTTINVTATIVAAGAFDNSATATAVEFDPNTANNTDSTGNGGTAAASADVSLVKTLVTSGPFTAGQSISYTLVVANAGPSTATSIQVADTPTNLSITNVSGAGCSALPCTIPSLASGANTTINVTATIVAAGSFDNSATAMGVESDPNQGNNTDSTGNGGTAAASADVSMVKTLTTSGPFTVGQSVTYSLVVANAGPSPATNIQVTDTPTNLTITNVSGSGCSALPCTIASLASGANTTITVTATINASGTFDNSATATGAESDPNTANNTDNTGNAGSAGTSADVSIVKTLVTAGPFTAGQSISYTLVVANAGPSTATSIQVTDTPTNLSITNVSGSGCSALPCTIASLVSSANTTINVAATIVAAGSFDNSATATGIESDPNTANNTDSTGNGGTAAASADVSLVKTLVTAGPFTAGQSISYTLVVANAGPSTATSIQVADTPTNLSITNVSGAGCSALPCTIPSLASGANATINVTATIIAAGSFDNSATATGVESDPNQGNNADSSGNGGTAAPSADVSMVKTLTTSGPFTVAQSVTYTLVVANAGPSPATNIQVTDTPTNLTITNVSGSGCSALPCTIASLASGANTTITVTATINGSGTFDNSATATAAESDPNTANNTDNTGNAGSAGTSADVSIVKTLVTSGPFTAGQSISYTLVVANGGPSTATSIQVTDTPTNLTITNVSGSGCSALPCTIASLASGANTTINVTATINAAGAFDNSATATPLEFDPNTANNTDSTGNGGTAGTDPASGTDIAITKIVSASVAGVGQNIDYTLTVVNNGPIQATGVTVNDPLPAAFTLLTASSTQGSCTGSTTAVCAVGTMNVGATVTITIHGTVTATGSLDNTATVTANESPDPTPSNNTSTATAIAVDDIPAISDLGLILLGLALAFAGVFFVKRS